MEKLFTDFNAADSSAWKERLEKDLKGITFEQLSVTDRSGITIHPFYTHEDIGEIKEQVSTDADWSICAEIRVTDGVKANKQALSELNNGASGLCFIIENDVDPEDLLQDIELPYIYAFFKVNQDTLPFAEKLKQHLTIKKWHATEIDCFIGFDFIHNYLKNGDPQEAGEENRSLFFSFIERTEGLSNICIDATLFQNAGAHSTYELACASAQVNEYLHILKKNGKLNSAKKIRISLVTNTAFFEQIAKLRAFRALLDLIFEQYKVSPKVYLHVETGNIYRSPFDSYSNLLRDTIAGMAAVIGGCDSLYIHPFDEMINGTNEFSLRMSRNQQLIFKEESYLNKVADVAAGSYYLETLTVQIAEQAWELFKEIENKGGLIASFEQIRITIEQQAQQLVQEYKDGKRVLVGANKFPNPQDEPKAKYRTPGNTKGLKPLLLSEEIIGDH